jgi:hypothetical protein
VAAKPSEAAFAIIEGIARMAVETDFSQEGKKLTIKVKGRFDFGKHQEFGMLTSVSACAGDSGRRLEGCHLSGQFGAGHAAVAA